jgi:hypothetical protein
MKFFQQEFGGCLDIMLPEIYTMNKINLGAYIYIYIYIGYILFLLFYEGHRTSINYN